ncbi:MAG TPA: hypothetical protein VF450_26580 [Noviherbaspirillum sp.]
MFDNSLHLSRLRESKFPFRHLLLKRQLNHEKCTYLETSPLQHDDYRDGPAIGFNVEHSILFNRSAHAELRGWRYRTMAIGSWRIFHRPWLLQRCMRDLEDAGAPAGSQW